MKVAFVFEMSYPHISGVVTSTTNLARHLVRFGHEVIFIVPGGSGGEDAEIGEGIRVRTAASWANPIYPGLRTVLPWSRAARAVFVREAVDVVQITAPWLLGRACIRAARGLGIPVVHTFHTMLHSPEYLRYLFGHRRIPARVLPAVRRSVWRWYGRYIRAATVTTVPSRAALSELRHHYPTAVITQIPNGLDCEPFSRYPPLSDLRRRYPEYRHTVVIYVGRLAQEKSIEQLIDSMTMVAESEGDLRLVVVGDGPAAPRYRMRVRRLGLTRRVSFLGALPREQLVHSGLLQHARAFATASVSENQPLSVLEAVCCRTPVIAPDTAAMRELVQDNGLRFEPGNVKALASALQLLVRDDHVYRRCVAASERLRHQFEGGTVARRFEALYHEIVAM